ncbi:heme-degrading domain-containing protein [Blastococcus sp. CT_GayMR19]|uniref:heme-degrading domain-containing protein n=1 Tax=Blastococcus sp. CT_GayMR19 TaxID=2559608 RepID=UPI0010735B50|nr:heme-degrading domain-containing protein [Blastococcus sp. CT_GayMR19]TFV71903.1 heme-degrading domain-containing protein [Blastococcus sp. CT_GayMR19]
MADDIDVPLTQLAAEEEELQFASFTNDDAWGLGCALVAAARRDRAPVAIDISRNGHQLFHAALPGAAPDNDSWIERKARVVHRFGHSSLYMRQLCAAEGTTLAEKFELDPQRYAAHGGAVPVVVRSVGPVGVVVVSGLPQLDDHRMVVAALRALLGAQREGAAGGS